MTTILVVSNILVWLLALCLAYLLLGTLRTIGILNWRFDQFVSTAPKRLPNNWLTEPPLFMTLPRPSEYENKRLPPRRSSIRRSKCPTDRSECACVADL